MMVVARTVQNKWQSRDGKALEFSHRFCVGWSTLSSLFILRHETGSNVDAL